jgi:hypothetical protein
MRPRLQSRDSDFIWAMINPAAMTLENHFPPESGDLRKMKSPIALIMQEAPKS